MATFGTDVPQPTIQQRLGPISRLMTFRPAPTAAPSSGGTFRSAQGGGAFTPINPGASTGTPIRPIGPGYTGPSGLSPTSPAAPQFTASSNPPPSPISMSGGGAFDSSSGAPGLTSSGGDGSSVLSSMPWYVWAIIAAAIFFVVAQPREVHIKA